MFQGLENLLAVGVACLPAQKSLGLVALLVVFNARVVHAELGPERQQTFQTFAVQLEVGLEARKRVSALLSPEKSLKLV